MVVARWWCELDLPGYNTTPKQLKESEVLGDTMTQAWRGGRKGRARWNEYDPLIKAIVLKAVDLTQQRRCAITFVEAAKVMDEELQIGKKMTVAQFVRRLLKERKAANQAANNSRGKVPAPADGRS